MIKLKKSLTVNPPYLNQLIGGLYALIGLYKCVPIVHGSQGCANYSKHIIVEHFKEPVDIATTGLTENSIVCGESIANIDKAIKNVEITKKPEIIGICTTGLSETIGEDLQNILLKKYPNKFIIPINTPSFEGSHINGYNRAIYSILYNVLIRSENIQNNNSSNSNKSNKSSNSNKSNKSNNNNGDNNKINIIPGMINPGDLKELIYIFNELNINYNLLTDIRTMDVPLRLPKKEYPNSEATLDNIKNSIYSKYTLCFGMEGIKGGTYLQKRYGVKLINIKFPIGIKNTDNFILKLLETKLESKSKKTLSLKDISENLLNNRGHALNAMANTYDKIKNKSVAIYGAPDIVIGLTELAKEIGLNIKAVMSNTKTKYFEKEIKHIDKNITIINGDLYDFEKSIKNKSVNFIIGDYRAKYVGNSLNIPIIKVGFPVIDVFGHTKKTLLGYKGTENLVYEIANLL